MSVPEIFVVSIGRSPMQPAICGYATSALGALRLAMRRLRQPGTIKCHLWEIPGGKPRVEFPAVTIVVSAVSRDGAGLVSRRTLNEKRLYRLYFRKRRS